MRVGTRVEIPAHMDAWMRGDRFGTVESVRRRDPGVVVVRLDKSGRRLPVSAELCREVGE